MDILIVSLEKRIRKIEDIEKYTDLTMDCLRIRIESGILDFDLKEKYELAIKEMQKRNINTIPYQRRYNNLMNIYQEVLQYG